MSYLDYTFILELGILDKVTLFVFFLVKSGSSVRSREIPRNQITSEVHSLEDDSEFSSDVFEENLWVADNTCFLYRNIEAPTIPHGIASAR